MNMTATADLDRSQASTALAKVHAYVACGKLEQAREWAEKLSAYLKGITAGALLLLVASGAAYAQAPPKPRVVTKPVSSISVKVMPPGKMKESQRWRITTSDSDSCVAWVNGALPNVGELELAAFRACRKAIDTNVDAAHAADEKKLSAARCVEDEPCWDCKRMGNGRCGPKVAAVTVAN